MPQFFEAQPQIRKSEVSERQRLSAMCCGEAACSEPHDDSPAKLGSSIHQFRPYFGAFHEAVNT
ncbi:MAG TPA: hypothetical protein VGU64_16295, partial [Terriglobales bacterium]|nr:hypothetical protein [Terriglobales bacterium]